MSSVQHVGRVVERVYDADGLTIACQVCLSCLSPLFYSPIGIVVGKDGKAAGQTIPHVHFHLLPRKYIGDKFSGRNDDVYPELERAEGALVQPIKMDAGEDRKLRTLEEMEKEASWLKGIFDAQPVVD